jgi:26S proteasome regulatory subunit N5
MADSGITTIETGRIVKMEVDYSATCDEKIPECKRMAQEGKMHDALDTLLALEKQTRTVSLSQSFICSLYFIIFVIK